jgi:hypothetical protein
MTSHKLDIIIEQMSLAGCPIFTPPFCGAGVSDNFSPGAFLGLPNFFAKLLPLYIFRALLDS